MKNVGSFDKRMRALVALCLFAWAFFTVGWLHWVLMAGALVLIVTAYFGYCPIWHGIKVDTRFPKDRS